MTEALDVALRRAKSWLNGLDTRSVSATVDMAALKARFRTPLPRLGTPPEEVVTKLADLSEGGLLGCTGGRFYAWVIGGALESALAADWLVSAWDQNAALYACGPAVSVIEEVAGEWLKELLDLPRDASFAFTTDANSHI